MSLKLITFVGFAYMCKHRNDQTCMVILAVVLDEMGMEEMRKRSSSHVACAERNCGVFAKLINASDVSETMQPPKGE